MSFVDLARRIVLGTSHWPGLREVYHGAYELGPSFTASRLRSVPGVLAVMLRFLDRLWRRYRSVKTTVPQLGEMEVMGLDDHEDHLRFGPMPTASLKRAYAMVIEAGTKDADRVLQREPRPARAQEITADALARPSRSIAGPSWTSRRRAPGRVKVLL